MRILLVSPFQPHPDAAHGGGMFLGTVIAELCKRAEVAVVSFEHRGDGSPMPGIRTYTTPRTRPAEQTSGARRWEQLGNLWDWFVRRTPLEAAKFQSGALRQLLRSAVDEFRPDVVLVEFVVMAWCLAELRDVPTVMTDHERGESVPRRLGPGQLGRRRDRRLWQRYVKHYYPMADLCQALTAEDAAALRELTGTDVEVRSVMVRIPETLCRPETTDPVLLFLGNYTHHPNPESARILAREVLPRVRLESPDAELWLAGPEAGPDVTCLAELPGVRVLGFVEDLEGLLAKARCLAAPMFSGSGVRMKSISAMAHGLPLVVNDLGLQGMDPPAAAIATGESPAELASACLRFLTNPDAAAQAGRAAHEYIRKNLSCESLALQQLARFESLRR